jgi:uncharacterized repeat protein (TIGR03806 family)
MQSRPLCQRACLIASALLMMLCGCGGNSSSNRPTPTPPPPPPPPAADTTAPSVPANLTATAGGDSSIDLTWTASTDTGGSDLSGYRIYRDGATTPVATINAPTTNYSDTGLSASTQYSYAVRAFDGAGNESADSSTASATTLDTPPADAAGLDERPANSSCVAWARPAGGAIQLEPFTSIQFGSLVALLQAPGDDSNWYAVEQSGTIKRFTGSNATATSTYGSVNVTSGGEMGLLGMTFHPDFPADSRVFVSYTLRVGGTLTSRISSFANSTRTALGPTETVLLSLNQPEENHNGGNILFGKDGYLYVGFGDGGGGGDAHGTTGNGQRLETLLGKMVRIDVGDSSATSYTIPADNPFAGKPLCPAAGGSDSCPEIYAWGFRNPWRWSFDRDNGALWVGDVGQAAWEEVDTVTRGGNYGWRCREGAHDYSASTQGCSTAATIDPVAEYDHSVGSAITGGYVYRGPQDTPLKGRYIFGDSGSGRIWAWIPENATSTAPRKPTQLADTDLSIVSFGEGNDGELYVVANSSLHRIVFQAPSGGGTVPTRLSATGCVKSADAKQPADGLIPYDINAPFWSDGAAKQRWIGLPDGSKITVQSSGDWTFPNGTVLMKNFMVGSKLIETRLFMRHQDDGSWGGYTYAWDDAQTDATLVRGGAVRDVGNGQQWIYPSEAQCVQCHTSAAGNSLGLETAQLNRDLTYAKTGRTANELFTLSHIQVLSPAIGNPPAQPALANPADTSASLNDRARAYLHTNCSQCHRPDGPTPSSMDLRYTTPLADTGACNVAPQAGDLGLGDAARLIAPGNAAQSIVVNRINRRDANAMPPVGSNVVDADGVALLTQWINGLTGC